MPRIFSDERHALDRGVSPGRPAAGCDAIRSMTIHRYTSLRRLGTRFAMRDEALHVFLVAENEPQDTTPGARARTGGYGLDALWNDDFHHTAHGGVDGQTRGVLHGLLRPSARVYLGGEIRISLPGAALQMAEEASRQRFAGSYPWNFVTFLENHDQVANSARGLRVQQLSQPGTYRALTALLSAGPGHADAFPGTGVWIVESRFFTSPIISLNYHRKFSRGVGNFWHSFPA